MREDLFRKKYNQLNDTQKYYVDRLKTLAEELHIFVEESNNGVAGSFEKSSEEAERLKELALDHLEISVMFMIKSLCTERN